MMTEIGMTRKQSKVEIKFARYKKKVPRGGFFLAAMRGIPAGQKAAQRGELRQ